MNKENEGDDDYMNISDDDDDNHNENKAQEGNEENIKKDNKQLGIDQTNYGNIFDTIFKEIKESMIQTEHQHIKQELNNEGFCIVEKETTNNSEDNWEVITAPKEQI